MATLKDVIIGQIQMGQTLFDMFTGDFSDAEFFQPPVSGTNHAGWIFGHIACSEDWAVGLITGKEKRIEKPMHDRFGGSSVCHADASKYPSRKEIDELYRNAHANILEVLESFDESRWDDPAPEGVPKEFFPTIGSMWGMQGAHPFWHVGQLTVCRVALGKPKVLGG